MNAGTSYESILITILETVHYVRAMTIVTIVTFHTEGRNNVSPERWPLLPLIWIGKRYERKNFHLRNMTKTNAAYHVTLFYDALQSFTSVNNSFLNLPPCY